MPKLPGATLQYISAPFPISSKSNNKKRKKNKQAAYTFREKSERDTERKEKTHKKIYNHKNIYINISENVVKLEKKVHVSN